jgi:hypothetical protein
MTPDSLRLDIYFRDGDFDLGLEQGEISPPYNEFNYLLKSGKTTSNLDVNKLTDYVNYKFKKSLAIDTLPNFTSPYDCTVWEVVFKDQTNVVADTVYRKFNEDFLNMFLELFVVSNDGNIEPYYFAISPYLNCNIFGFNGRFPRPFKDEPPTYFFSVISAKEGVLKFRIAYPFLRNTIGYKKFLFKIHIKDRALHVSNIIETQVMPS